MKVQKFFFRRPNLRARRAAHGASSSPLTTPSDLA